MAISAWTDFAKAESPDGRFEAAYVDAMEIAMGAPTSGTIAVTDKKTGDCLIRLADCNGSLVWSADSSALAFPRWTRRRMQQLVLLHLPSLKTEPLAGEYRVLELSSFQGGIVEGIDSPIYQPATIRVIAKKEPNQAAQTTPGLRPSVSDL